MEDAVVSISTPIGKGAVAIVRMSGKGVLEIASKIFSMPKEVKPRYMYFGKLKLTDNSYEECLMVYFKAPFSYTGEDIVEFQVH
ncbi:MAG: tRNA uridine-5-carboxymethylaminomethyl(34) synthesis GTPase MnmE, partial [Candidatus Caccovivens sp.]